MIYKATKGGEFIGAAVEASSNGFGGALKVLVGFDKEGNIIDYSLLSHAETPGLGSKAADWFKKGAKGDITGKNPGQSPLVVKNDGGDVDAITASTITSRAFLNAVNAAYAAYSGQNVDTVSGATQQAADNSNN
jgi:electron transport complex protein RnfG